MWWLALLIGCIQCSSSTDVDVYVEDAAGNPLVPDAATLTLSDGSTLEMTCIAYEGSPGGICSADLAEDDPTALSVEVTVGTATQSMELPGAEPGAECGMGLSQRATVVLP
jgi:hypothetical protein